MKRLAVLLVCAVSLSCNAAIETAVSTETYVVDKAGSSGVVGFIVSKIEFRSDLTRVYGSLVGRPHTSARIDSMILELPSGSSYSWTDIDGVDAKRYFQWEDTPEIEVEIDFPVMKPQDKIVIKVYGPNGESIWSINKTAK